MNNQKFKITFITDPILLSRDGFIRILRRIASLSYTIKLGMGQLKFGGHPGVTRSVVVGMEKLGVEFNYNPTSKFNVYENVVVLSSVKALKQAIELKKSGTIKRLIAGPNLMDVPTDYENIFRSNEIDLCIVPSKWRQEMFFHFDESMKEKCKIWPSGVDVEFWKPDNVQKRNKAIIYLKNRSESEESISNYIEVLKNEFSDLEIISYGSFSRDYFKAQLNKAVCMIAFTNGSETQGLVWLEAWAMNVPTFILDHKIDKVRGHEIPASSAPYLSESTGEFFATHAELKEKVSKMKTFSPRKWVLENMTDEICAKKIIELFETI